jgi:hypothetical protein
MFIVDAKVHSASWGAFYVSDFDGYDQMNVDIDQHTYTRKDRWHTHPFPVKTSANTLNTLNQN